MGRERDGYATKCGKCGGEDCMEVAGGTFQAEGMRLSEDGFSTCDANTFNTSDEYARCRGCGHVQGLYGERIRKIGKPRNPGIADLPEWIGLAKENLKAWDGNGVSDRYTTRNLRTRVDEAVVFLSGAGLAYVLAQALSEEDIPNAGEIAGRVAKRMVSRK